MAQRSKAARKAARNRIDRKVLTREKLHARDVAVQLFKNLKLTKAVFYAVLGESGGSVVMSDSMFDWTIKELSTLDYSVEPIEGSNNFMVKLERKPINTTGGEVNPNTVIDSTEGTD
jgi:hypothetical protein